MTTALVTGAGGFVARHLAPALRRHGVTSLVGADALAARPDGFDAWHVADLMDAPATRRVVKIAQPSLVLHLVGRFRGSDAEVRESNVTTAANLLDAVRAEAEAARVVLVGSAAEYGAVPAAHQPVRETFEGAPTGAYGRAKREVSALGARAVRERGMHVVVARPFNVVGAGIPDTLVAGAIVGRLRAALAGPPLRKIRIGSTDSVRDFVDVQDVAEGLALAAKLGRPGESYNLCSGEGHRIADLLERLLALAGEPIVVEHDAKLVRAAEVDRLVGDRSKARDELGWRPSVALSESLRAAWESSAPECAAP